MTEQSFFKRYLSYKIKKRITLLCLGCIVSFAALVCFALGISEGLDLVKKAGVGFYYLMFISYFGMIVLPIFSIFGAVDAFTFYTRKNLSDTIGCLPLSYKQRFWGDFLSGYAASVLPVVPFGIISTIILSAINGKFNETLKSAAAKLQEVNLTQIGIMFVLTVLVVCTLGYIFGTAAASVCGKGFTAFVFAAASAVGLPLLFGGASELWALNVIGINTESAFENAAAVFPPFGLYSDIKAKLDLMNNIYQIEIPFKLGNPVYIAAYVILGAALLFLAYSLGKRRKTEHAGTALVYKPSFYIVSAICSAGVTLTVYNRLYYVSDINLLFALIGGIVTFFVAFAVYHTKKALFRGGLIDISAIVLCLGAAVLLNKTAAFGKRYLPESNIAVLKVNEQEITDLGEKEQFMRLLNEQLRKYPTRIWFGDNATLNIEYKTSGGKTTSRSYGINNYVHYYTRDDIPGLNELVYKLFGYGKRFFENLDRTSLISCSVQNGAVHLEIPQDKTEEFIEILSREASEKYDFNASVYAEVNFDYFDYHDGNPSFFNIQADFGDTIAFIESLSDYKEKDPDSVYLALDYSPNHAVLHVTVPFKQKDDERVKELVSLLENHKRAGGSICDGSFKIECSDFSTDYRVPIKNRKRVIELMTELVEASWKTE